MVQYLATQYGGEPNPLNTTGLCLLSLDGGGVRGLSTLYILKSLMALLNHQRQSDGLPQVKPCEVFDLIGGTSTGGLIAIMLGRLEMDVDTCIASYSELMKTVFEEKSSWFPVSWSGKVKARFDSAKLKSAIEDVVSNNGASPTDAFNDGKDRGCRTFVCATATETAGVTRLRSYTLPDEGEIPATICEAALATSAATGFFNPISIRSRQFVDGALGANNPVDEVEGEAANIWSGDTGDLKPLVKCFVSIGTGNPGKKALEDDIVKFLSRSLVGIATETEETERKFIARWAKHYDEKRYFRFNVDQGLQQVGLAEYKEQGRIEAATDEYLRHQAQKFRVRDCIKNLQQKQSRTESTFSLVISEYTMRCITKRQRGGNAHWIVPCPVNSLFTGRAELTDRIQSALRNEPGTPKQKRLVITGIGGMGKSEVCLKIADAMREDFWGVFWVDVSSPSTAKNGFLAIAKALGSSAESIDESLQALANIKERWLLVLDNADDPAFDYAAYTPSGTQGAVIITSRVPECSQYSTLPAEALEGLEEEHSMQLLLKAARVPEASWQSCKEQAKAIVELLGSHTLALIQAGAYIAEGYYRLDQYCAKYKRLHERLLKHYPKQQQSRYRHVYATFEASVRVLNDSEDEVGRDALDLLGVLSMLHSSVLPLQVFPGAWKGVRQVLQANDDQTDKMEALGRWHVSQLPEFIDRQTDEWDDHRLNRASALLASLSLVTRHRLDDLDGLSMHPLVHAWAKDRLGQEQHQMAWEESETWQSFLPPSVEEIFSFGPPGTMLPILLKCGWVLNRMREDNRLKSLLESLYVVLKITPSEPSPEHIRIWDLAAISLGYLGHARQAVGLLEHVVKTHPDRLASQHALGFAYQANRQMKEAVGLLEYVVKVQETMLAETHPDRLASQHTLGFAYQANRQTKEAVGLLEHVVKVRETTLAETHPDRLASQHVLASVYWANGQMKEAVGLLEHVVKCKVYAECCSGLY
ncbi:FabD/lysophospholipase-like protein [Westerdykella ornata]|uniref:FabD/lysophospholipase-like protein n=1 Tax=Westerdykella ornata TaxID=318751 RepID=A0A6A6JD42_WESOR|nr:FabD/lysophospholipase-like protein [Westerdykella ornata]KAF2274187.1 FabD/lysophospholipase-like protein [Westerdykella ornata]